MPQPRVVFYDSLDLLHTQFSDSFVDHQHVPGLGLLSKLTKFWASNFVFIDRTGTVTTPINTETLPNFGMPAFQQRSDLGLDQLCQQRAQQLLDLAETTGRRLVVLYSGGIDSTLILISLIKVAKGDQLKKLVRVLLSDQSRNENPRFYTEHLLGNFHDLKSSYNSHSYLGDNNWITVTGEGCDQMFGSSVFLNLCQIHGNSIINKPCTNDTIEKILVQGTTNTNTVEPEDAEKIRTYYDRVVKTCPVNVETVYHYFWWLNFAVKWQSVFTRLSSYTHPDQQDQLKYEDNYFMFFGTNKFQLWAMNNHNNMIRDNWTSYKYVCKDIIYDFTQDADYRDRKLKYGSLLFVLQNKPHARIIDNRGQFYYNYPEWVFNSHNDLAELEQSS